MVNLRNIISLNVRGAGTIVTGMAVTSALTTVVSSSSLTLAAAVAAVVVVLVVVVVVVVAVGSVVVVVVADVVRLGEAVIHKQVKPSHYRIRGYFYNEMGL